MTSRDPLVIPTAHVVAVLAAKKQAGHWLSVLEMERGRRRTRAAWNAVLGALILVGTIALWYGAMALWSA